MAQNSAIEWTHHTFNPWTGCTKVSAGCANCYAETLMDKRYGKAKWGPSGTRVIKADSGWREPFKWDRTAGEAGERHRVFCASLADVFEGPETMPAESVPLVDKARDRLFALIHDTPNLDWLLLTKRPQNVQRVLENLCWPETGCPMFGEDRPSLPANVWLGTSVENQATADERIPHLLRCPAAVRFLSMEPLLGAVDLSGYVSRNGKVFHGGGYTDSIDWVIVGGESGHGARPMHPQWARDIRDQCQAAGVPFHFKQWGEYEPTAEAGRLVSSGEVSGRHHVFRDGDKSTLLVRVGKKAAGRELDGRTWDEFPATRCA